MTIEVLENPHASALEVRPIGGRIGAEIHGVRLASDLPSATVDAIRQALLKHKVIFFRHQSHLDEAEQEAFGRLFGDLVPHPTVPSLQGTDNVLDIDGSRGERASSWHTDVTFVADYPKISILRGVVVPEAGGDTLWANTVAAYHDLPEALRAFAGKLWLLHSNVYDYVGNRQAVSEEGRRHYNEVFTSTRYETEHPLVHVHPETGERALILGHFAQKVIGYGSTDSAHLLAIFQEHIIRPENTVRWRWSAGDVAIWDNRATQHRAIDDYGSEPRVVRRVTIAGEPAVSVDGRRSVTRSKVPAAKVA
jgi:alpha-ketoglutarate-dependent sulfate ester dioxygenase